MPLLQGHESRLACLLNKLRHIEAPSSDIVAQVVSDACTRLPLLNKSGAADLQIERLIKAAAWADLAIALIAVELPGWKLRRLVYDDGIWHCSLSKNVNLPLALDDSVDVAHEDMPLAIMSALVEARRRGAERKASARSVPQLQAAGGGALCCDNFA